MRKMCSFEYHKKYQILKMYFPFRFIYKSQKFLFNFSYSHGSLHIFTIKQRL